MQNTLWKRRAFSIAKKGKSTRTATMRTRVVHLTLAILLVKGKANLAGFGSRPFQAITVRGRP